jgi:hypothetical protein
MLCGGIARDRRRARRGFGGRRGGCRGLRRDRLSGLCQKTETQCAEAQGTRGECKTHGYFLNRQLDEQTRIAVVCSRPDEASMKLR